MDNIGKNQNDMINEKETWEYWENKFRGMSESEIEEYWKSQRKEAHDESSMLMDFADEFPGIRAEVVEVDYKRYINAKKQHDAIISKSDEASLEGINQELEAISEERTVDDKAVENDDR